MQWIILMNFTSLANFINKTQRQTFIKGRPGVIQCSALGNPAPQFKWSRKDGRSIKGGRFIQLTNGSLKVEEMHREDTGIYTCTMKQSRGTESTSEKSQNISVRVIGKMRKKNIFRRVKWSMTSYNIGSMWLLVEFWIQYKILMSWSRNVQLTFFMTLEIFRLLYAIAEIALINVRIKAWPRCIRYSVNRCFCEIFKVIRSLDRWLFY